MEIFGYLPPSVTMWKAIAALLLSAIIFIFLPVIYRYWKLVDEFEEYKDSDIKTDKDSIVITNLENITDIVSRSEKRINISSDDIKDLKLMLIRKRLISSDPRGQDDETLISLVKSLEDIIMNSDS